MHRNATSDSFAGYLGTQTSYNLNEVGNYSNGSWAITSFTNSEATYVNSEHYVEGAYTFTEGEFTSHAIFTNDIQAHSSFTLNSIGAYISGSFSFASFVSDYNLTNSSDYYATGVNAMYSSYTRNDRSTNTFTLHETGTGQTGSFTVNRSHGFYHSFSGTRRYGSTVDGYAGGSTISGQQIGTFSLKAGNPYVPTGTMGMTAGGLVHTSGGRQGQGGGGSGGGSGNDYGAGGGAVGNNRVTRSIQEINPDSVDEEIAASSTGADFDVGDHGDVGKPSSTGGDFGGYDGGPSAGGPTVSPSTEDGIQGSFQEPGHIQMDMTGNSVSLKGYVEFPWQLSDTIDVARFISNPMEKPAQHAIAIGEAAAEYTVQKAEATVDALSGKADRFVEYVINGVSPDVALALIAAEDMIALGAAIPEMIRDVPENLAFIKDAFEKDPDRVLGWLIAEGAWDVAEFLLMKKATETALGGKAQNALLENKKAAVPSNSSAKSTVGNASTTGACFPVDTVVTTQSGFKPVQSVRADDQVWGYDLVAREWKLRRVVQTYEHNYDGDLVAFTVAGEVIEATSNHPVWVIEGNGLDHRAHSKHVPETPPGLGMRGRWLDAGNLELGDVLLLKPARQATITQLSVRQVRQKIYNFQVEGLHNYAVGMGQVLVHNKPAPSEIPPSRGGLGVWGKVKVPEGHLAPGVTPQEIAARLPVYVEGEAAHGALVVCDRVYLLKSNPTGRAAYTSGVVPPELVGELGFTRRNFTQLEAQSAAILRRLLMEGVDVSNAYVVVNRPFICTQNGLGCAGTQLGATSANLSQMLPPGQSLTVYPTTAGSGTNVIAQPRVRTFPGE